MAKKYIFWILFSLFVVFHACLVLNITYFPFPDVPNHLAEGTIFRYYNEASNKFNEFYTLNYFFYPNTFHLFFFSLPIFPSVETANRILHLLIVVSLPILVLLVIIELKGNKWFAIISFILVYGFNLAFGFTNNAIANNVALLILWLWLRNLNKKGNSFLNMAAISFLLVTVYFLHAMMALFCLLMVFSFIVYRYRKNFFKLVLNSLYLVPLGLLVVYWWFFIQNAAESSTSFKSADSSTLAYMKVYYATEFIQNYAWRVMFLFSDNYQLFAKKPGYITGVLLSFIILVPFLILFYKYAFSKEGRRSLVTYFTSDDKLIYILLFLAVTFFCYFLLPIRIPGQEPLFERFGTILLFALLFLGSRIKEVNHKIFAYAACLVALTHLLLWTQYFRQFDQDNKEFAEILPQDNTKVLSYMNYDPAYRGRMVYDAFQNYFIAKKKGISTSKIIDYRFGMIRRKESGGLPFQGHMYYNENPRGAIQKADYLLIRGTMSPDHQRILDSVNTFHKVKDVNNWHLLKRG